MTDRPAPLKPRGPVVHDLRAQTKPNFELMCFRLIKLEFPDAIKPSDTQDGGADALLPGTETEWSRAWQAKHFPDRINWNNCRKSYEDARSNFHVSHYTFCFPRNLTKTEQKTFNKHFKNDSIEAVVDFWNGEELQGRLLATAEGQRVASYFFADPGTDMNRVVRAIEAGGALESPKDATDRLRPIGEYLTEADPFFRISAVTYESGQSGPEPHESTVFSVTESDEKVTRRLDLAPRDDEAMELFGPRGRLLFPKTESGKENLEKVSEAIEMGSPVELDDIKFVFDRLPPALADQEGTEMEGRLVLNPMARPMPAPWKARMRAQSDRGREVIEVDLEPVEPPPGWDGCLQGNVAGLTIQVLFRQRDNKGEMKLNYEFKLGPSPARSQLNVLLLMDVLMGNGKVKIADREGNREALTFTTEPREDLEFIEGMVAFMENVVEIESWTGQQLEVPKEVSGEEFADLAKIAAMIRQRGMPINLNSLDFEIETEMRDKLLRGGEFGIQQDLGATVFGSEVELGPTWIQLELSDVDISFSDSGDERHTRVRLDPKSGVPMPLFQKLLDRPKSATGDQFSSEKVSRNDPCPCGSGKKFKKCHGA